MRPYFLVRWPIPPPRVRMASARRQRGSRLAAEERRPFDAQALRTVLRGPVVTPEGSDYDETRKLYNAMINKRPAAIARSRDVADVIQAVKFGREQGLDIAVRGRRT